MFDFFCELLCAIKRGIHGIHIGQRDSFGSLPSCDGVDGCQIRVHISGRTTGIKTQDLAHLAMLDNGVRPTAVRVGFAPNFGASNLRKAPVGLIQPGVHHCVMYAV